MIAKWLRTRSRLYPSRKAWEKQREKEVAGPEFRAQLNFLSAETFVVKQKSAHISNTYLCQRIYVNISNEMKYRPIYEVIQIEIINIVHHP